MLTYPFFAATRLNVNPDVTTAFLWIFAIILVGGMGYIAWIILSGMYRQKRTENELKQTMVFDEQESTLYYNNYQCKLTEQSLEFYVCKAAFDKPNEYHSDVDILYDAEK